MKIILTILIIHVLLNVIRIPLTTETLVSVSGNASYDESTEEKTERQCFTKEHEWNFEWEGYNDVGIQSISPKIRLYNAEDRSGTYHLQFGFFDQSKYNFERFREKKYDTVRDILPWSSASMYSENITVPIGANEDRLITSFTPKPDPGGIYWVYALITAPSYNKCETTVIYINKTSLSSRNVSQQISNYENKEYKTLWQLFMDWAFS